MFRAPTHLLIRFSPSSVVANTCSGTIVDSASEIYCDDLFRFAAMVRLMGARSLFMADRNGQESLFCASPPLRLLFASVAVGGFGARHNIEAPGPARFYFRNVFVHGCTLEGLGFAYPQPPFLSVTSCHR